MITDTYFTPQGFVSTIDHGLQFFTCTGAFVTARPPVPVPLWRDGYVVAKENRDYVVQGEPREYAVPKENRSVS